MIAGRVSDVSVALSQETAPSGGPATPAVPEQGQVVEVRAWK